MADRSLGHLFLGPVTTLRQGSGLNCTTQDISQKSSFKVQTKDAHKEDKKYIHTKKKSLSREEKKKAQTKNALKEDKTNSKTLT